MPVMLAAAEVDHFLRPAFFYLLAAVISVPLAKRLGLGSVLGYLIAGACLGPAVLNLVGDAKNVMHFAEFGVVMMLFLVGLEVKPGVLWKLRGPIFGLGGCQVLVTGMVLALLGVWMGWPWQQSVAAGFILSMSSTAIVLQTMGEKGQMHTAGGQASFAVLLFQDLAVIPLLALLPLLAAPGAGAEVTREGFGAFPVYAQVLLRLGAVLSVVVAGRYLLRPAFRIIAHSGIRELFTASALLLVIGTALLMEAVGLSAALGTFLAGVVLAESEFRHELESNIEPFKGLLLGIFFMSVGAGIDFALIRFQPVQIVLITIGVVVVKLGVLHAIGRAFRYPRPARDLVSFYLAQVGEFAFVLLNVAEQGRILPPDKVGPLTAVTALSMALTPLVLLIHDRLAASKCNKTAEPDREADEIDEKHNPVIIAGYGRVGHIVGRLMNMQGVRCTVIDLDADQVDLFRKLGTKIFYGDASREDLLHAAGAAEAKLFVLAIDDEPKSLEIVDSVRRHYPNLHILARASGRIHAYDLLKRGVHDIWRETLDSSLEMGIAAMRRLGFPAYEARRAARVFRAHDEATVHELADLWGDEPKYIAAVRQRIEILNRAVEADRATLAMPADDAWDTESLTREARGEPA
ncbi:MAG: monovalent cation:proton antiporter-2 (CPA2) family protein [Verrucomicrobiota bacterium]